MGYNTGSHTLFHHRYHIVWVPKYRYKVLHGEVRLRVRENTRQVCAEMGVTIVSGALSRDHVHMFVEIPPHIRVCDFVRKAKGRSSRKIQQEFDHIRQHHRRCYHELSGQAYRARQGRLQPLTLNLPASAGQSFSIFPRIRPALSRDGSKLQPPTVFRRLAAPAWRGMLPHAVP